MRSPFTGPTSRSPAWPPPRRCWLDPLTQTSVVTVNVPVVNYLNTGGAGHFGSDSPFPGTRSASDVNDFVTLVTGDDPHSDGRPLDLRREQRRRVRPGTEPGTSCFHLVLPGHPGRVRHPGDVRHSGTGLLCGAPGPVRAGRRRVTGVLRRGGSAHSPSPAASTWSATSPAAASAWPTSARWSGPTCRARCRTSTPRCGAGSEFDIADPAMLELAHPADRLRGRVRGLPQRQARSPGGTRRSPRCGIPPRWATVPTRTPPPPSRSTSRTTSTCLQPGTERAGHPRPQRRGGQRRIPRSCRSWTPPRTRRSRIRCATSPTPRPGTTTRRASRASPAIRPSRTRTASSSIRSP